MEVAINEQVMVMRRLKVAKTEQIIRELPSDCKNDGEGKGNKEKLGELAWASHMVWFIMIRI